MGHCLQTQELRPADLAGVGGSDGIASTRYTGGWSEGGGLSAAKTRPASRKPREIRRQDRGCEKRVAEALLHFSFIGPAPRLDSSDGVWSGGRVEVEASGGRVLGLASIVVAPSLPVPSGPPPARAMGVFLL